MVPLGYIIRIHQLPHQVQQLQVRVQQRVRHLQVQALVPQQVQVHQQQSNGHTF